MEPETGSGASRRGAERLVDVAQATDVSLGMLRKAEASGELLQRRRKPFMEK
jgi:hypothetical protein